MKLFHAFWNLQRSSAMNFPRNLSFAFRSFVARESALYFLYYPYIIWGQMKLKAKNRDPKGRIIHSQTELVIDGFQGSANSFATEAFVICQTKNIHLAHHLHSPTQIIQGIKQQIPVLLTIREPEGAIISLLRRWPHLSVSQSLKGYIAFYQKLEKYSDHYVVSNFQQTTQSLDLIVDKLNKKFATNFDLVDTDRANRECREKFTGTPDEIEKNEVLKKQIKSQLCNQKNIELMDKAKIIYKKFETFSILDKPTL
jgi:hypothetical protein